MPKYNPYNNPTHAGIKSNNIKRFYEHEAS